MPRITKFQGMKALITAALFGILLVSCNKGECVESPLDCNGGVPMTYIPVCGCNNITYPNKETAECHGITQYRYGECEE